MTVPALSIRLRIALLVGLALLGAAAFAAVDGWAGWRIERALATQDGFRRLDDLAADSLARALALQVDADQFLREGDDRFATAFRDDHARLVAALSAMRAVPEGRPGIGVIVELDEGFREIGRDFARLEAEARRLGLGEDEGLRGRLRASVKAIESELVMWPNAGPLMVAMLQMRQAEKDFMLYRAEHHLSNHTRWTKQFDMALDAVQLPASSRQEFRALLAAYAEDFQAFGVGTVALSAAVERLRGRQAELRPLAERVFVFARDGIGRAIAEQEAVRTEAARDSSVIGLLAVLAFAAFGSLIAMGIVTPLRRIEQAMKALAAGDHAADIPGIERRDEIGDMARAVAVFKRNAVEMVVLQGRQDQVRREAETASRNRVLALAGSFEGAVSGIAEVVTAKAESIHQTAGGMAGGGEGGGNAWSLTVAEAAEQARHTVAAVTAATVRLTGSVGEVAASSGAVGAVATTAVSELGRTEERVRGLAETAGRIERVVALIGDIAQRTNMLSLNASIEATRAGEAGKGFAVVANEVKRLAMQTADSTREIAAEVTAIQQATGDTVAAIAGVGTAIRRIDVLSVEMQGSVTRQGEAAREIERCVADVAAETQVLSDGVAAFTHSAARQCGAAARVLWAAEDLAEPTRTLRDEVAGFLSTVRAA